MTNNFLSKTLIAGAFAALVFGSVSGAEEKNVVNADFRALPADFETLPYAESAKWNFGFRPYGSEAASVLWSDPRVIRNASAGDTMDEKHLPTALYVSVDEYGLNILGYGALKSTVDAMSKGNNEENIFFEMFFIPGDADDPVIINYQPMGINTVFPYWRFKLSWMKEDRNVRTIFDNIRIDAKKNKNGVVLHVNVPWVLYWDHLPVFQTKKDNFWRLSMIRWGGSCGGETWGGVVHSQTKCGYIRMPAFTPEQQTKMMKTTLFALWGMYQDYKNDVAVGPGHTGGLDAYRKSIDKLPHSWMNMNEDPVFKKDVLIPMIRNVDAIGKGIAEFETLSLDEQKAFYLKNAPLVANFRYDLEDAYAEFLKAQMMKE